VELLRRVGPGGDAELAAAGKGLLQFIDKHGPLFPFLASLRAWLRASLADVSGNAERARKGLDDAVRAAEIDGAGFIAMIAHERLAELEPRRRDTHRAAVARLREELEMENGAKRAAA
jgi:hypothetical protein